MKEVMIYVAAANKKKMAHSAISKTYGYRYENVTGTRTC